MAMPGRGQGRTAKSPASAHANPMPVGNCGRTRIGSHPNSTLPALEAVLAAKEQGFRASEDLDLALRHAFWVQSRCITNRAVILDVAATTRSVDPHRLADALDDGHVRPVLAADARIATGEAVVCSPHVFVADGTDYPNPGMDVEWLGDWGVGFPRITKDTPAIYDDILKRSIP